MFNTLRARLWLTYILLIAVVLCVVGSAVVIYLARNPLLYRQTVGLIQIASTSIAKRAFNTPDLTKDRLQMAVEREDAIFDTRILLLDENGQVIADSRKVASPAFPTLDSRVRLMAEDPTAVNTIRDSQGGVWLFTLRWVGDRSYLVVAAPRPRLPFLSILRDDLFRTLARAGLAALILAFLLGIFMSRWMAAPLQRLSQAIQAMAAGKYHLLEPQGPAEIQFLARAFNEMSQQVQTSQQSQRDFIANVSHELKTPLTSIQGFSQAIIDGAISSPQALREASQVIYAEAGRMYRLVMDLLTLARLEAGTANFERAPIDLTALLGHVVTQMTPLAQSAGVALELYSSEIPTIIGDGDRLNQVFTNLLDNAIQFSPKQGLVCITSQSESGMVQVRITDQGPGIPAGLRERIFDRFYQIDTARKTGARRGSGLGLPIAREIVRAHGGTIRVESSEGQGSAFVVSLPLPVAGS